MVLAFQYKKISGKGKKVQYIYVIFGIMWLLPKFYLIKKNLKRSISQKFCFVAYLSKDL